MVPGQDVQQVRGGGGAWPVVEAQGDHRLGGLDVPDHVEGKKLSGEGGGEWTVDLASAQPSVKVGIHGTANCTIEVSHEDFKTMLANPMAGMQLYFQGKLRVSGDPMLATKLQKLFSMA